MTAGERRILQQMNVAANVIVVADGSGNYRTVLRWLLLLRQAVLGM